MSFFASITHAGWINARNMGPSHIIAPIIDLSDIIWATAKACCLMIIRSIHGRKKETKARVVATATTMRPTPKAVCEAWMLDLLLLSSFDMRYL